MESHVLDASTRFPADGDSLSPDPDLYDADVYDVPDPGLLRKKNGEAAWLLPQDGPPKRRPHWGAGCVCQGHNALQAVP